MGIRSLLAKMVESKLDNRFSSIEHRLGTLELGLSPKFKSPDFETSQTPYTLHSQQLVQPAEDERFTRKTIFNSVGKKGLCLEIGPYFSPIIAGKNARYFDVFDTEELRRRAKLDPNPNVTANTVPVVHYSDPNGDISIIKERFSEVVSSHSIEHQPDLIGHLEKVYDLLEKGGRYIAIAPDKRFCFDHFCPLSTVGDVIQAGFEQRQRHSLASIVNMRGEKTHNDPTRHWGADHLEDGFYDNIPQRIEGAIKAYEEANGDYIDCHAWYFTPQSFAHICDVLYQLKKVRLRLEAVGDTRRNSHEFAAIFRRD